MNFLNAIWNKLQSFIPKAPSVSQKIDVPPTMKINKPPPTDYNKLQVVGEQKSPLQQAAETNPQIREAVNQGAQAGGGPPISGEGGSIQIGGEGWSSMEDYNKDLQRAREMGFSSPLELRNYLKQQDRLKLQQQATPTPAPVPTPPPVSTPAPMFNPQNLLKTIGQRVQQGSQSLISGLGNLGSSAVQGGSNLLGAVSRAVGVPTAYSAEPGQIPEPAKGPSLLAKLLPFGMRKGISQLGYNLHLGGAGISQPEGTPWEENRTPSNVYAQLVGGIYDPKEQSIMSATQQKALQKALKEQLSLPKTPPDLSGGGGGGGTSQLNVSPDVKAIIDAVVSDSRVMQQIAQMGTTDLDAYTAQKAQELGITQQQAVVNLHNEQIMKVGDEINNIEKDINAEAGNFTMTDIQRRRLIAAKQKPLRDQLIQLMRTAQYAGIGLDNSMKMLSQYIDSKKATMDNQFRYAQLNQTAEDERKKRLLATLPYLQPTAAELLPYTMKKKGTADDGGGSGGGEAGAAAALAAGNMKDAEGIAKFGYTAWKRAKDLNSGNPFRQ